MISKNYEIKIFVPFFILGKFPKPRKKIFRKNFFSRIHRERYSQYFLTKLVVNERYFNAPHMISSECGDFAPQDPPRGRNIEKTALFLVFLKFPDPMGLNRKIFFHTYV